MATPLTAEARKQMQFDVLWNTMADNELLPYSGVQSLNKQLNTDNKIMIKAINELLSKLLINDTTVANFSDVFNNNIGNPELDTLDWDNLRQIDTNVIRSIYKVYLDVVALSDKVLESYTTAEKTKLAGIADNANNYVHPANHPATMITEDTTHRFVTDTEKTTWNAKASNNVATTGSNGLMSAADKTKLDGVASNANNYVHPANHPASIITQDTNNRFVTDAEKTTWNAKANAVHGHSLSEITDVDVSVKTNGHALIYDSVSGKFKSQALPAGSGSGATSLDGLSDVDTTTTAPTEGAVLKYVGGVWKPVTISGGSSSGTQYVVSDSFSGSANVTKNYPEGMSVFVLDNLGASDVQFVINGNTFIVKSGEETFEGLFDSFTSVQITTTSQFKALVKSVYNS